MRQSHKTILIWAILILMFVSIYSMFTDSSTKEQELDATAFHQRLQNPDERSKIEKIQVEERGHNSARFLITYKNNSVKTGVYGDYALTKEVRDAGIASTDKVKEESSIWPQG